MFNLDTKKLRDIFSEHGGQIINWENDNCSMDYYEEIQENEFKEQMLSMVKNGQVNEEEVIDFINNRICSL